MAAHHYHHDHHPTTCCGCSSGYGSSCNCTNTHFNQPHHCSPPSLSSMDPLLQAIASQVLQSSPPQPHLYSRYSRFHTKNRKLHNQFQHPKQRWHQQLEEEEETHFLISSLVSRIEALEATLHRFSPDRSHHHSSLRDVAARVIQAQYRAFLVRRSRTLSELKDLALIKSAFTSLKSSLSNETHFDFDAISRKAMDLLVKLDSIQGDDSMVRDGKRSISRDLVRFLEFIDGVDVKRYELSVKARKNVRSGRVNLSRNCLDLGGDQRETIGKMRERVEKIKGYSRIPENDDDDADVEFEGFQHVSDGDNEVENPIVVISGKNVRIRNGVLVNRSGDQPRVKKSVSFAENGNLFKVFSNSNGAISNEDESTTTTSSDDHGELGENIGAEVEQIKSFCLGTEDDDEEEGDVVNGGASQTRNGEKNPRTRCTIKREANYKIKGQNGEFVFSAPLPVQMEDKADLLKRRNELTILR